jgi:hypothetical protein
MSRTFACSLVLALSLAPLGCGGGGTGDVDSGVRIDAGRDAGRLDAAPIDATDVADAPAEDLDATAEPDAPAGDDAGTEDDAGVVVPVDAGRDAGPPRVDAGRDGGTVVAPDAGRDSGGTGARDAGGGGGCLTNADCAPTDYCDFAAPFSCTGPGSCTVRPGICPAIFMPVCACNGMTYSNACVAAAAGENVASSGMCGSTTPGCCRTDFDCASVGRGACIGADPTAGIEGTCHDRGMLAPGECWDDLDCGGGTCVGARVCPCGALCILPDAPGNCM